MNGEMPAMSVAENKSSLPGETEAFKGENPEDASTSATLPSYNKPDKDVDNNVKIPLVPKNGIKVIATRKGFFGQLRVREGDKFIVKKFEDLGEWMECEDPSIERDRIKFFKDKKAKK